MKKSTLIISLIMVATVTIGGTLAWLTNKTSSVNGFAIGEVNCSVISSGEGNMRQDIKVKNTSNIDSYIRVNLISSWIDNDGNIIAQEVSNTDLSLIFSQSGDWFCGKDGYYYCRTPIAAGAETPVLIESATLASTDDKMVRFDVLAEAIQAVPRDAVTESWGVTISLDGNIEEVV